MHYLFISIVLVVGLSGLVTQSLLLRELLVSFLGNELTLGIILANWIIQEALGVFIIGKIIDRARRKIDVFVILQIIFSLALPFSVYLARTFKSIIGVPFAEGIGLWTIFYASFFIILPVSLCHGALFSSACKIYSSYVKSAARSIASVYTWETIGTILGGVVFTYLFLPRLNSFQIALLISILNLAFSVLLFKDTARILKLVTLILIFAMSYFVFSGAVGYIQRFSINKQWKNLKVLEYQNSVYANIAVTKQQEQYTFFYNGLPIITTPFPDVQFVEDFGNFPLLFHRKPKNVLIISAGAGGLMHEVLKHPLKGVDYLELDSLIISMLKKYPTKLTESELNDKRARIINLDGRFFLKSTPKLYDVVFIGLSNQSDLSTNRLFTQEFFSLIRNRLNQNGILALWLPGSLSYLSQELKDINSSILNSLKENYEYIRIIPGDYNIFLASSSPDITEVSTNIILERINERKIDTVLLKSGYINYRLSNDWADWFKQELTGATGQLNQDLKPYAVFETLLLWNKKFSPSFKKILENFKNLNLKIISIFIFLITVLLFCILYFRRKMRLVIAYSIFTTGFFAMLINLILIFAFQTFYGYLYHRIGLLISIFMGGIAFGSILMTKGIEKIRKTFRLFFSLELLIIAFSYTAALLLTNFNSFERYGSLIFFALFFLSGVCPGMEFVLAGKIYLKEKEEVGETAGLLYCADLLGAWLAGILGGIVFLPVLGLFNSCMAVIILKLCNLALLIVARKGLTKTII